MSNKRPSATSFLSTSSKALQTQQDLAKAQERIGELELELEAERQQIQSKVPKEFLSQGTVTIADIQRRPYVSRREKDAQLFNELVDSIRTYGFRGSIWVQKLPDGQLRLIAGETRLDAAIAAGLTKISVDIVETDDITAVKLSRVENARRRNLNALDDTEELLYLLTLTLEKDRIETISTLYRLKNAIEGTSVISDDLRSKIESTFEEVAPDLSLMTFITSRLPLLNLPKDVLEAYTRSEIAYTKAIELGRLEDDATRQALLTETIDQGLSLSELKARLRPPASRTVITKMEKLKSQVEGINKRSIQKLSSEQRQQFKATIDSLKMLLEQKQREIEEFEAQG
ncbi:ParB N-terminal domain-containing protein [Cyanobacteria bacterium FACHB-63]|nr:ParB N-terminal domain-containing protein [Cyanobacteria bacterium FACHB-63]